MITTPANDHNVDDDNDDGFNRILCAKINEYSVTGYHNDIANLFLLLSGKLLSH